MSATAKVIKFPRQSQFERTLGGVSLPLHGHMARQLLNGPMPLTDRERAFAISVYHWRDPVSSKQMAWLRALHHELCAFVDNLNATKNKPPQPDEPPPTAA